MEFAAVTTASEVGGGATRKGSAAAAVRLKDARSSRPRRREGASHDGAAQRDRGAATGNGGQVPRPRRWSSRRMRETAPRSRRPGVDPRTSGVLARGMAQPWRAAACRGGVGLRWCGCGRTATDEQCALAGKEEGGAWAVARARRSLNGGPRGEREGWRCWHKRGRDERRCTAGVEHYVVLRQRDTCARAAWERMSGAAGNGMAAGTRALRLGAAMAWTRRASKAARAPAWGKSRGSQRAGPQGQALWHARKKTGGGKEEEDADTRGRDGAVS
ncbi:unnamed protein product [Miscanthus lutarioriparius]|uniref:Uncharacterized protein n=1 Tax=Miscanthus lutarioriparius TaxID=422564 RepID=A0A811PDR5_9POAL|nr:unnamed protein product [Miscanthus lutarioriparius]